jgi:organic hydroperoxide reductase OsmC/OhrA
VQALPHIYRAHARGAATGAVEAGGRDLPGIATWPPPEFDGPPGHWSPESLLLAAVADCFVLSFRAVARASRLEWEHLDVQVEGVLEQVDGVTRFTRFTISPRLSLADAASAGRAPAVLAKAKRVCLVTNSLNAQCVLDVTAAVPAAVPA